MLSGGGVLLAGGNSCGVGEGLTEGFVLVPVEAVDFLIDTLRTEEAVVFLPDLVTGVGTR